MRRIFFRELFNATAIRGVVLFKVLKEYKKINTRTNPKIIQDMANIVIFILFLNKNDRYRTLAALIPSFNSPGA